MILINAKEYLKSIRRLEILIENNQEELKRLETKAQSPGFTYSEKVAPNTSSNTKANEVLWLKIAQMSIDLEELIQEYYTLRYEIMKLIERLDDADEIKLLYLRYLENKSWKEITIKIQRSEAHTYRIHTRALENLERIMNND